MNWIDWSILAFALFAFAIFLFAPLFAAVLYRDLRQVETMTARHHDHLIPRTPTAPR